MKQSDEIEYLNYTRAFACILVVLGHLVMSFQDSKLIDNTFAMFFRITIYHFHVYLFFFCSGYLFQKSFTKCKDTRSFIRKKAIRCLDFAITYVIFSFVTYIIKVILSGSVNSEVTGNFFQVLFITPINQMWYLCAIIAIILVSPVIRSPKSLYIIFSISIIGKLSYYVFLNYQITLPTPVSYLLQHQVWFLLGMIWEYKNIRISAKKAYIIGILFAILSTFSFIIDSHNHLFGSLLTFLGIVGTVEIIRNLTKNISPMPLVWKYLSKYMYQIYLLHTICAACIRIILLKLNIRNLWIHIVFGLFFSFVVPIICAMIAEKSTILNIVFFPSKTISKIQKQKASSK